MATIKDYRELRVYQVAFEAAIEVYELTKTFPIEERYSLTDQIRRASRSVCANIAEAWRKRRYPQHFVSKLSDADAEAAETIVWLDFALRFNFLSPERHQELQGRYNQICAQLTVMMSSPGQWAYKSSSRS
jgi:four helix bundle protein